eukprot:TRINITY_DN6204_c0_g1_i3.p4 TRINITY_DN6204_c0_g1~~TRINITY_DN6204_c0_g1_i3.p4  ORF type:complete len:139 (-),score=9.13 TRINITY_DN6204_c0_g1_i3:498-914(-)
MKYLFYVIQARCVVKSSCLSPLSSHYHMGYWPVPRWLSLNPNSLTQPVRAQKNLGDAELLNWKSVDDVFSNDVFRVADVANILQIMNDDNFLIFVFITNIPEQSLVHSRELPNHDKYNIRSVKKEVAQKQFGYFTSSN